MKDKLNLEEQECIPVGCVPSAAVAVPGGVCLPGGGCLPARGCLPGRGGQGRVSACRGVSACQGEGGICLSHSPCEQNERHV